MDMHQPITKDITLKAWSLDQKALPGSGIIDAFQRQTSGS